MHVYLIGEYFLELQMKSKQLQNQIKSIFDTHMIYNFSQNILNILHLKFQVEFWVVQVQASLRFFCLIFGWSNDRLNVRVTNTYHNPNMVIYSMFIQVSLC